MFEPRYAQINKSVYNEYTRPSFQRPINSQTVDAIFNHIDEKIRTDTVPILGIIYVAELRTTFGVIEKYIVDGQHRFEAIKRYTNKYNININVNLLVYPCLSLENAREIFNICNLNVIVPDYILSNDSRQQLLRDIQSFLSGINGCNGLTKRPNINLSNFMDRLSTSNWMSDVRSLDDFKNKITIENNRLCHMLNDVTYIKKQGITDNMLLHWRQWGNFIGVDNTFSWLSIY